MNDQEFAYRVRALLTEGEDRLNHQQLDKLKNIRALALSRQKNPQVSIVNATSTQQNRGGTLTQNWWPFRLSQLSAGMALLTLVLGLVALSAYEDMLQAEELADIDTAVLTDTLPPDAYADNGFSQFLRQND